MDIDKSMLKKIISDFKSKKELTNLDDDYVEKEILRYLQKKKKIVDKINSAESFERLKRSSEYDKLLKTVRASLRAVYGVFVSGPRGDVLNKLKHKKLDFTDFR